MLSICTAFTPCGEHTSDDASISPPQDMRQLFTLSLKFDTPDDPSGTFALGSSWSISITCISLKLETKDAAVYSEMNTPHLGSPAVATADYSSRPSYRETAHSQHLDRQRVRMEESASRPLAKHPLLALTPPELFEKVLDL